MKTRKLKFKNGVVLENNVLLAPMAGWSDVGFRSLCYKFGAGLCFTEMISAKALVYGNKKTFDMLATAKNEKPVAVQLFGKEPEVFAKAVRLPELQKFDIIDINMGCPAPKIVKNGEGSFLLTKLDLAREIIRAVRQNTDKVLSVKMRRGYNENDESALQLAKICEEEGVDFITVHGRTKAQGYSGDNDIDFIKKCVTFVSIPVIANGDIVDETVAERILKCTGAAGIMIGRGALGNTEIFAKCTGKKCKISKKEQILYHFCILEEHFNSKMVSLTMKKHLAHYARGLDKRIEFTKKIMTCETTDEMKNLVEEYF